MLPARGLWPRLVDHGRANDLGLRLGNTLRRRRRRIEDPVEFGLVRPARRVGRRAQRIARTDADRKAVLIDHRPDHILVEGLAPHFLVGFQLPVGQGHFGFELLDRTLGYRDLHEGGEGARRRGTAL